MQHKTIYGKDPILGDLIVHIRKQSEEDSVPDQRHPRDSDWVWTKCCGFIAYKGNILDIPILAEQPLINPGEVQRLYELYGK